jgi:hypothetical protein
MGRVLRSLKWAPRSEGRAGKPRQHHLGRSPYHRRLLCEALEARTLLSVGLCQASSPTQQQTLEGLPAAAQHAISSAIGQDQSAYHAASAAGGASLANPANGFTAQVQAGVLRVSAGSDTWEMSLMGLGCGGAIQPVGTAKTTVNGNRVDCSYGTIDEWYVNGPGGLEQGFTMASPQSSASGLLTLELALGGDLTAKVNAAGDGISLTRPDGSAALGYTGLVADDATGKALPAVLRIRADGSRQDLLIDVNIAGAQGPITIDPFVQEAKLTASDGGTDNSFGGSVAISGNTVVVGASGATIGNNANQGAAYVFTEPASGWSNMTQTAKLTASDGAAGDEFGSSVSISGSTIVVGAPSAKVGGNSQQGTAYVFVEPGSGWTNMTQTAKLTASDGAANDDFGDSVSISGNTVVVGASFAPYSSITHGGPGAAYVFTESGAAWTNMTETAKLTASDGAANDSFGDSVSISGNTVVVGASGAKIGGSTNNQGAAYVFTEPGSVWTNMTQTAKFTASDGAAGDSFGASVSIGGNTVVVAAPLAKVGVNSLQGAAYVFTEPGSAWTNMTQTAKLTASDGAAGDEFGSSISISGNTVVVGAASAKVGGNAQQGTAYVFVEPGSTWTNMTQTVKFTASDGAAGDFFGSSISISGNTVMVGTSSAVQGAAYVFGQTQATQPVVSAVAPASGSLGGGTVVTISGTAFTGTTLVDFGTLAASSFTIDSDTQITAVSPAGAGTVNVTVTTPGGKSAVSSADQFTYKVNDSIAGLCASGAWWAALSSAGGSVNQNWGSWSPSAGWQDVQVADVNGDGKADIVGMASSGAWYVAINNGTGFATQYWGSWDPRAGWKDVHVADVNGDGKADIVGRASSGAWYAAVSNGTSFVTQYWGAWAPSAGWQDVQVADVNGDGKADIVGMTSWGDWWVAVSNGTSFASQRWGSWNPSAGWEDVQVADLNGDGKSDILGRTNNDAWYAEISTGTSFVTQYWGVWDPSAGLQDVLFADVNGDGKADIIGMTSSGAWYVGLNSGTGFVNQYWGSWDPSAGWQYVQVADVNADGKADIVGITSSGAWYAAISNGTSFVNQYLCSWNPAAGWQPVLVGRF